MGPCTKDHPATVDPVIDKDRKEATDTQSDIDPFIYVEKMPSFPGGSEKMYEFIYTHLTYPEQAKKEQLTGHVIIQFTVKADGHLTDIKVIRDIGGGCGQEAARVVELMNENHRWTPGYHEGKAVPVKFTLPFKFKL